MRERLIPHLGRRIAVRAVVERRGVRTLVGNLHEETPRPPATTTT
jgi:hypothetical protein